MSRRGQKRRRDDDSSTSATDDEEDKSRLAALERAKEAWKEFVDVTWISSKSTKTVRKKQSRPKSQSPTRTRPLRSTRLRAKSQDPPTSQPVVQVTESGVEDDPVEEGGSSDINDPVQQRESSGLPIRSGSRAKKRKFSGNRYTIRQWNNNDETKSIPTSNTSTRPIKMSIGVTNVAPKMSIGMTQEDGLSIRPRSKSLTCSGSPIQTRSTRRATSQDPPLQNRSSVPVPVPELRPSGVGASSWKLQSSSDSVVDESRQNWSGFRIIDIDKVFGELKEFLVCSRCFMRQVTIYEKSHVGLSSIYYVECLSKKCGVVKQFRGCDLVVDGRDNRSIAEVNRRSVYAFKSLGLGHAAYAEFCGLMDFPAPVNSKTFSKAVDTISLETSEVADASMKRAAKEETKLTGSSDISVSGDGSWHTKGFSSKLGICTLIGLYTGKVIDFFVLSLVCKICDLFKGPRDSDAFLSNQANHAEKCTRNHVGSSKSMEVQGMKKMFQRSVMKRNVRYKRYIGDGDSATYKQVSADKPYGEDFTISKFECTSHVKKRMGTRLRNEKKALKGKKLSDNGSIGGRGRLTDKAIDQIALYYGIAVKSSKDVESMKIAIWAIYYHMSASDSNPSHQFCPKGLQSWCSYQKAAAAGELTQYKHKKNLPLPVMEACKNVFDDLTKTELLERCVGGYTQNPNESLNAEVWNHCPKAKNFGKKSVEFASAEATICWNEGHRGKLEVMKKLGIKPGNYCVTWAIKTDQKRTVQSNLREEASSKEARQAKKREMLHQLRNENDDSYVPGGH